MEALVLVGGGGHASDVLQAIEAINDVRPTYRVLGLVDDATPDPRRFRGRGVAHLGPISELARLDGAYVLCVGWPQVRRALWERAASLGATAAGPIVAPSADVGAGVELGEGSVVLGNAHLSPLVRLGAHSLVSYTASVGHDSAFGDLASIMPGANISGDVHGGHEVLVGTGASVLEGRRLGDRARVGAGAVVVDDVPDDATVLGVPARLKH
jgi:sugar O-acyltransferase (sialic acid O-acetyltransferase NeuD family)